MRTVQEKWESYLAEALPADAPEEQVIECRRAFYAGSHVALSMVMEIGRTASSTDAYRGMIDGLTEELNAFHALVRRGEA